MSGLEKLAEGAGKLLETVPQVYEDFAQPTVQEVGKFVARVPKLINALASNFDIWIAKKDANINAISLLIENELRGIEEGKIISPEAYIAIPALLAMSYTMNSDKLRNMYAKLLASSMNIDTKESVHPSYVEIIKQMSPLDAQNLALFPKNFSLLPLAQYCVCKEEDKPRFAENIKGMKIPANNYFVQLSNVFIENTDEKDLNASSISISNLERLGLVEIDYSIQVGNLEGDLPDDKFYTHHYDKFLETELFLSWKKQILNEGNHTYPHLFIKPGSVRLTSLGRAFRLVCIQ